MLGIIIDNWLPVEIKWHGYNIATVAICCYLLSIILQIIVFGLQYRAQYYAVKKEMIDIMPVKDINKATIYEQAKLRFKIFSLVYEMVKGFVILNKLNVILALSNKIYYINTSGMFFLIIFLIDQITSIPLSLYHDFVLEAKFGYNKKTFAIWIYDLFIMTGIFSIITIILYSGLSYLISKFSVFYIYAGIFITLFKIFLYTIYPTVIAPIFNKFTPMDPESDIYKKILVLANKIDFNIEAILIMDGSKRSNHSNAYFTGFGKIKKIIFFDTLLAQIKVEDQILAVLCHEFGHFKKYHLWKILAIDTIFLFIGLFLFNNFFGILNVEMPILIYFFTLLLSPTYFLLSIIRNFIIRQFEKEADMFAIQFNYGEQLIEALKILTLENTTTLKLNKLYSLLFLTHPGIIERIEFIKNNLTIYKKSK